MAEVVLFICTVLQGIAAAVYVATLLIPWLIRKREGDVSPFVVKRPFLLAGLILGSFATAAVGFWFVFRPPAQKLTIAATMPPSRPVQTPIKPAEDAPIAATPKPARPTKSKPEPAPASPAVSPPSSQGPTPPVAPIPGGVVQTMSDSPGGMQAGHDLTVIGALPPPVRTLNPDDVKKAVALLQANPMARIFLITFPTRPQVGGEISNFANQLESVFAQGGWVPYRERNVQLGSVSQVGENFSSHGEGIGCSLPQPPTPASQVAAKVMALLDYPCAHPSVFQLYGTEDNGFALYISVGTRIKPEQ
jgi:hypothetical protein